MTRQPLVSLVLVAYKQESFVRAAVRSALAQAYEPMEVILSDDCSPDRTFVIMREEAEAYRGPHKVILNCNTTNYGLIGNLNRAWEMSHGDLLVVQGGDDVSLPQRVQRVVAEWLAKGGVPDLLYHAVSHIDESGRIVLEKSGRSERSGPTSILESIRTGRCTAHGSACAYARRLHDRFGPLDPSVRTEDQVYPFLALLGGGVQYIDEVLLEYRIHDESLSRNLGLPRYRSKSSKQRLLAARNNVAVAREWLRAWQASGRVDPKTELALERLLLYRELNLKGYGSSCFGAFGLLLEGMRGRLRPRWLAALAARHVLQIDTTHA